MTEYTIYTNNPKVQEHFPDQTAFYAASARELLNAVRSIIHKGEGVVSSSVPGNIQPVMNPYKSILVFKSEGQLDLMSLRLIDQQLAFYKKHGFIQYRSYTDDILAGLQAADLQMTILAITGLAGE